MFQDRACSLSTGNRHRPLPPCGPSTHPRAGGRAPRGRGVARGRTCFMYWFASSCITCGAQAPPGPSPRRAADRERRCAPASLGCAPASPSRDAGVGWGGRPPASRRRRRCREPSLRGTAGRRFTGYAAARAGEMEESVRSRRSLSCGSGGTCYGRVSRGDQDSSCGSHRTTPESDARHLRASRELEQARLMQRS